jgi:rfaE bifunctional protein nucleotidyltransferase chain/domain
MNKILTIQQGIKAARKLKKQNKTIIVAGGFFDILHPGHIKFLKAAKKYGDYLFILLEEDARALKKGKGRPVNSQENRAKILSAVQNVDCIVLLKNMTNDQTYDKIIVEIRPDVIAVTFGDPNLKHKQRQAKLVQGKVVNVIRRIDNRSTTKYINLITNKKQ